MNYYLPGVQICSQIPLESFEGFTHERWGKSRILEIRSASQQIPEDETGFTVCHKELNVSVRRDGWLFFLPDAPDFAVHLSRERDVLEMTPVDERWKQRRMLPLIRTAIECVSAMEGVVSLHSACVQLESEGVCFSAPSGVGKSTRAAQWAETLGAEPVSGDRPSLYLSEGGVMVSGVPWDGKEGIYRNVQYPLKMICSIVRSDQVSARRLSRAEARQLLMRQCFIPMWDTDAAAAVLTTIRRLLDQAVFVELCCGPDAEAARESYELIYHHPERILEETNESEKRICYENCDR